LIFATLRERPSVSKRATQREMLIHKSANTQHTLYHTSVNNTFIPSRIVVNANINVSRMPVASFCEHDNEPSAYIKGR
jgi:hypothetical protein